MSLYTRQRCICCRADFVHTIRIPRWKLDSCRNVVFSVSIMGYLVWHHELASVLRHVNGLLPCYWKHPLVLHNPSTEHGGI
jgi:hypothetical protein